MGTGTVAGAVGNVAIGHNVLEDITSGDYNTALGFNSGASVTSGGYNVFIGYNSGDSITTSAGNVFVGISAGASCTETSNTVLIGNGAGEDTNITGAETVAVGYQALKALGSGANNVAIGSKALTANVSGSYNTAVGNTSLDACTGGQNAAFGWASGGAVIGGTNNVLLGTNAGNNITTGSQNTCVGDTAITSAVGSTNQTVVGYGTTGQADNAVTLGNASVTAVYMAQDSGATVHAGGLSIIGDSGGGYVASFQNDGNNANRYGIIVQAGADDGSGTTNYILAKDGDGGDIGVISNDSGTFALSDLSDARKKENIKDTSIKGIDTIKAMKVRDFDWKKSKQTVIGGFVAQELKEVFEPAVIGSEDKKDADGNDVFMGVSRERLVPVLVKAIQELSAKVTELESKLN
jgi:hypothetical protein